MIRGAQRLVQDFHWKFGCEEHEAPQICEDDELRLDLIHEEFHELDKAFLDRDLSAVADAIADLLYVTLGTAVACGIDIEPIFLAVHNANMLKDGGATRSDGKILKPPGWVAPDVAGLLRLQGWKP